jgi:hypothetical protein
MVARILTRTNRKILEDVLKEDQFGFKKGN